MRVRHVEGDAIRGDVNDVRPVVDGLVSVVDAAPAAAAEPLVVTLDRDDVR